MNGGAPCGLMNLYSSRTFSRGTNGSPLISSLGPLRYTFWGSATDERHGLSTISEGEGRGIIDSLAPTKDHLPAVSPLTALSSKKLSPALAPSVNLKKAITGVRTSAGRVAQIGRQLPVEDEEEEEEGSRRDRTSSSE